MTEIERVDVDGPTVTVTYRAQHGRTRRAVFTLEGGALRASTPWHDHPAARRAAVAYLAARGLEVW